MAKLTENILAKILRDVNNPNIKGFGDPVLDERFAKFLKNRKAKKGEEE